MSKQALTDAGVGRALFTTRFRLSLQAGMMCLVVGALPCLILPLVLWFKQAAPYDVDLVRFELISRVLPGSEPHRWFFRPRGERGPLTLILRDGTATEWLTREQAIPFLQPRYGQVMVAFRLVLIGCFFSGVLGFWVVLALLRRFGAGSQQNQRVRGAELVVDGKTLSRRVRREGGGIYTLAEVALPRSAPMAGILAEGAQRSGKSLVIHDLMCQVFARGRKCIVFDQNGEYFSAYFRPGKDLFFNPALEGSVPWSIFSELRRTYDADTMALAFLPQKSGQPMPGNASFFEDAARAVFSAVLLRLAEAGAVNTRDIAKAVLEMPAEQMDFLIRKTVASSAIGGDSKTQRQGVISSISIYLSGLAAVPAGRWSMREFMDRDDDARLFILGTDDTKAMFAPLHRLLLTTAFAAVAAKQEIAHEDRYWFFLDEAHDLGDVGLDRHLATLGKFGVCVVAGIQAHSQWVAAVGTERAETISNCFNTALLLRANEANSQERIAKRLGKLEMDTVTRNQALAVAEWRDGAGLNKSEHEKWLVMPAEIGALKACTGWLKLVGDYPAAKVDYRHWIQPGSRQLKRFAPRQPKPPKDPRFDLRLFEVPDPFASVQEAFSKERKAAEGAKAAPAPTSTTEAAVPQPPVTVTAATASSDGLAFVKVASPVVQSPGQLGPENRSRQVPVGSQLQLALPTTDQDLLGHQQQLQGDERRDGQPVERDTGRELGR